MQVDVLQKDATFHKYTKEAGKFLSTDFLEDDKAIRIFGKNGSEGLIINPTKCTNFSNLFLFWE
jgi:hypothetical protein